MAAGSGDLDAAAAACLDRLRSAGATLAAAESLTGGLLSATLAAVPGASDVLRGAVVAYASDVKISLLGVDPGLVTRFGVVSAQCAQAMARGVTAVLGSTWGVATTGVAGPDRQDGKPVGTVYVAVHAASAAEVRELALSGGRGQIQAATVAAALDLIMTVSSRPGSGDSRPGRAG